MCVSWKYTLAQISNSNTSINQDTVDFISLHKEVNRYNNDYSGHYAPSAGDGMGSKLDWFDEADSHFSFTTLQLEENLNGIPLDISHDASTKLASNVTTASVTKQRSRSCTQASANAKQLFRRTPVSDQLTQREILCATSDDEDEEDYFSTPIATTPSQDIRKVLMLRRATAGNKIPSSSKQVPESDLPVNAALAILERSCKSKLFD